MAKHGVLLGIVTMNRKTKLEKTLSECQRRGFHNVVVVDNGSTDGTREFLSALQGNCTIFSERNEGGSGGFNRIMRFFIEQTTLDWLMLFDDDAYPKFDLGELQRFLNGEESLNAPAYAFKVVYPDGALCAMNRPGRNILDANPFTAALRDHHIDERTGPCDVDFASFVGILLGRETIQRVGYVSREFFIYSDDTYYTLSVSSAMGKLRYCPQFVFVHDCRRSSTRLNNHNSFRLRKDVVNKIVLLREYSRYWLLFTAMYLGRLALRNPTRVAAILRAGITGLTVNLVPYRNEAA
jgi:rhamnopyranosyl-N-acetylglucosaminyl-diphospho-decaprenol beta-1,3/1,4-galactofuranosyltransferase